MTETRLLNKFMSCDLTSIRSEKKILQGIEKKLLQYSDFLHTIHARIICLEKKILQYHKNTV